MVVTDANPSLTTVSSTEPGVTSIRTSPLRSVTYVRPATTTSAPATGAPAAVTVQVIADWINNSTRRNTHTSTKVVEYGAHVERLRMELVFGR